MLLINTNKFMRYKYTDKDIEFLKENYPLGNWDKIMERFPNLSRHAVNSKMHKLGISFDNKNKTSSKNFDYIGRTKWLKDEEDIIRDMYSKYPIEELVKALPNRSKDAIILRANKLGLLSYYKTNSLWTEEQKQYIIDNWELEPDKIMAKKLNKTFRAVKAQRELLGIYRRDMSSNTYPTLAKYLRGQNQKWKNESMKNCDYKCVLTGSKDFEIHHLYGVSNIIEDIFKQDISLYKEDFSDYSNDELSLILERFLSIQNSYPLGECIDKKLHTLFHSLFGQYYNTPEQWHRFKEDYLKGIYINID